MNLSKAFDCIPHDLLIAKLATDFRRKLYFIFIHTWKRKQYVKVNNIISNFQTVTTSMSQESVVGPIYIIFFFNVFFFFSV